MASLERRSAARTLLANGGREQRQIACIVLDNFRFVVERHQEGHVLPFLRITLFKKSIACVFFEFETRTDAIGSIEQNAYPQWQIGFAAEESNLLWRSVFQNFEVCLIEVGDEIVAAVSDGSHQMHETCGRYDGRRRIFLCFVVEGSGEASDCAPEAVGGPCEEARYSQRSRRARAF